MAEPMGHIKHGKYIKELKTRMSKYEQIEYPLFIVKGDPDLDGTDFSIGRAYITQPLIMGGDAHSHDFDQILFFLGGDPRNPTDFDAEIEVFLDDKYELVNRASFVHVPAGIMHCPLIVKKVNKPFIFLDVTLSPSESDRPLSKLAKNSGNIQEVNNQGKRNETAQPTGHTNHGKYIREIQTRMSKYPQVEYPLFGVEGGKYFNGADFSMGLAYITKPFIMGGDAHSHDFDQILFFLGGDPRNTTDFDAEIEIFLEDKYESVNYASFVHVPAGSTHCPLIVKKVNKPFIFIDVTLSPSASNRPLSKLVKNGGK